MYMNCAPVIKEWKFHTSLYICKHVVYLYTVHIDVQVQYSYICCTLTS